ncbi:MAG: MFS transporter, partial [Clostridiaceae bacterium]|nr:MFS transporter [Clostridiaceae bacterium]
MVGEQSQSKINLYKLLAASTISDLGSNIYKFALAMYVLDITKSASTYTTIAVCGLLPGAIISM